MLLKGSQRFYTYRESKAQATDLEKIGHSLGARELGSPTAETGYACFDGDYYKIDRMIKLGNRPGGNEREATANLPTKRLKGSIQLKMEEPENGNGKGSKKKDHPASQDTISRLGKSKNDIEKDPKAQNGKQETRHHYVMGRKNYSDRELKAEDRKINLKQSPADLQVINDGLAPNSEP